MADDPTPGTTGDPTKRDPNPAPAPTGDPQGDPGVKPGGDDQGAKGDASAELVTERAARAAAEKRATEAEAEASRLRRSNAAQKGTDLDALRTEVRQEFTEQLVRAEIRAAAAGKLRDPADALALLDVSALAGSGGDIDVAAVAAAVAELVKNKPYLAAAETAGTAPTGAAAPWGDVGAGPRGKTGETEPDSPLERLNGAERNNGAK
ncbi:hypothetical protein AB0G74_12740 [Streptomyces sp. NPDC020875]|uniref:hypothetical protein n=1 Tax=Streptomyces sp. NPDC020875 TaxID=3154898 RepID=UPI0033DD550F